MESKDNIQCSICGHYFLGKITDAFWSRVCKQCFLEFAPRDARTGEYLVRELEV